MKKIISIIIALMLCFALAGCREADVVSRNVSKEADNFNVVRRITVFNIRTDTVLLQMTGKMSLRNEGHDELSVLVEVEKDVYQKHFIYSMLIPISSSPHVSQTSLLSPQAF